jgi:hypothetical protein
MSLEHSPGRHIAAYSISGFCDAHSISRSKFYDLMRQGLGPRLMDVDGAKRITAEAAADWRREREAAAGAA